MKIRRARLFLSSGLAILALAATGATAATYNVSTNADNGAGSLRSAIAQANAHAGADTITFDAGLGTISLTTGQIDITEALTINGPTSGQTIDANETARIFGVTAAGQVLTLRNLELKRGATDQGTAAGNCTSGSGQGAAVCALGAVLLNNSTITQSFTLNAGGGGIYVENGDLIAIRSVVTVNSIFNANPAEGGGGIYVKNGAVALLESVVAGNHTYGPFAAGGGIFVDGGALIMSNSTLSGNGTLDDFAPGGGAHVANGDVEILASTVSGNSTASAATQSFGGGLSVVDGDMTISASTVTDNHAAAGHGLYLNNGAAHRLDLYSTILAGNGTDNVFGISGTVNASYSLFGDGVGEVSGTNASNVFSNLPDLIGLNNNGCANPAGKPGIATAQCPRTHLPNGTSPAIDAGDNPWGYATDQRGTGYARTYGSQTDIGAIENGPGLLEFSLPGFSVAESGPTATITVARRQGSAGAVSVAYATSNGTAIAGSDYTTSSGTLNWAAGDGANKSFTVPVTDDGTWETSETVNLTLSNPGGNAVLGPQSSAILTINDNDSGPGLLQFSAATYSVAENGGLATINVQRVGGSNGVVMVDYATSNGTATAGSDYTAASGTLMWGNGDSANKTFNVQITNDGVVESDETISLTLSNPQFGALVGSPGAAVLTILDNDGPGRLEFSAPTYTVSESAGSAQIIVNRVGGSGGAISVQFNTSNGTATAGADYAATPTTLNWANGDAGPWYVYVPVFPDALVEASETVHLALSNPTGGATLGSQNASTLIITDDAPPTTGRLRFSSATYAVSETAGTAAITVSRVGGSTGAASVAYATVAGGTAIAGTDYLGSASTLNWADGDVADKTFYVTIFDDMAVDGTRTVNLQLSNPGGGAALGSPSTATLSITDNETLSPGQLQFSAANYAVGEAAGSATITVTRTGGTDGAASVQYATGNGTATIAGGDYLAASGTLNWGNGDGAAKTFTVTILNDGTPEGNETINLTLSSPSGASLGTPDTATLTILANDSPSPGALRFSKALYLTGEGGGVATITVSRVGGTAGAVAVDYATGGGTATAGSDYTASSGTLNWSNGDAADKTYTVPITDDSVLEGLEWTFLVLSNPAGGATLRSPRSAVLAIIDNEPAAPQLSPPTVAKAFGTASLPLTGSTTLTFNVANPNAGAALAGVGFTDNLPAGLVVATPNGLSGSCGGGTIAATAGSNTVSLSGAMLAASSNCAFAVNVTGVVAGVKDNTTDPIAWGVGSTGAPSNTATLTVIPTLDIDGSLTDTRYDALTDGLLVIRYLFGLTGSPLTSNAVGGTAVRSTPAEIEAYLGDIRTALDVDGNGIADALTDGLMVLRYMFSLRGNPLIANAFDPAGSRNTAPAIEAYIQSLMPQ